MRKDQVMFRAAGLGLFAILVCAASGAAEQKPVPIPQPNLENLEVPIQNQLVEERARLDALVEAGQADDKLLAGAFGFMGQLYFLYELFEVAEPCFLNARRLDPADFRWHYYLGVVYQPLGAPERARESLEEALTLQPDDLPALLRMAQIGLEFNNLEAAEQGFRKALAAEPNSAAAHDGLGRIAYQRKDFDSAIEHLTAALRLQPKATSINHLLGLSYRELGEMEKAREHLKQNRFGFVTFRDPLVYGLATLVQGARYHLERDNRALERHNIPAAIDAYREAISIDPEEPLIRYNLAVALERVGSRQQAIDQFLVALELDPDYRDAHFNLAVALGEEGRVEEAAHHFEKAYRIDPEDRLSHLEWTSTLFELGRMEQAEQELRSLLREDPESARAWLYLSAILSQRGESEEVTENLIRVLELSDRPDEKAQAHALLGVEAERGSQSGKAIGHYRSALELDPELTGIHGRLAGVLARSGKFDESANEFAQAVSEDPLNEGLRFGQAMALLFAEEYPQARTVLEEGLTALPKSLPLKHLLARVLATCPDPAVRDGEQALQSATEVVKSQGSLDQVETLAMALAEMGRFREAADRQRQVVAGFDARNAPAMAGQARRRLKLYEDGSPCRAPWLGD
jgi:tetratricopeptide (TPR) repeat protein